MSLPPSEVPQGAIRFNTDSQKLEFYAQGEWWVMSTDTPNLGTSGDSTPGPRGLFMGNNPGTDMVQMINISSTGDAADFANLSSNRGNAAGCGSRTRAFAMGIEDGAGAGATIDTMVFASSATGTDFGDLGTGVRGAAGASNSTRGLCMGGYPATNKVQALTMASTGTVEDFGTLTSNRFHPGLSAPSDSTRAVFGGGEVPGVTNSIEYVTIATNSGGTDFGDLSFETTQPGAVGDRTRAIICGGRSPSTPVNTCEYVTIQTTGNATNFGDLTDIRGQQATVSSSTRGVSAGGWEPNTVQQNIDYTIIQTQGNFVNFGDLNTAAREMPGASNAHGGL